MQLTDKEVEMIFPILDLDNDGSFDLEELTNFVQAATRTNALQQRIVEGSRTKPGSQGFLKAKEIIHKVLSTVPGRQELQSLQDVFALIAPGSDRVDRGALQNCLHRFDCEFTDQEVMCAI